LFEIIKARQTKKGNDMKATAAQKLQALQLQIARLEKEKKQEEKRKIMKLGEYISERMPQIVETPGFDSWLKKEIDRRLFGLPLRNHAEISPAKPQVTELPKQDEKVSALDRISKKIA